MNDIKVFKFANFQEAWQGINEYFLYEEQEVWRRGGGIYGPEFISYNNMVYVDKPWVDPDFDFGRVLGYSKKKWNALIKNYVDMHYLDMIRAEISTRVNKQSKSYNYTYHFRNAHGSGKDCLISMNFTKRLYAYYPIITFYTRVSEVTKRLIFDFLLVQRIVEYIYGSIENVKIQFYTDSFYCTAEGFVMLDNIKPVPEYKKDLLAKGIQEIGFGRFQRKVFKTYNEYQTIDIKKMTFKVHMRSAAQVQKDKYGNPVSKVKSLKAWQLTLDIPSENNSKKIRLKKKKKGKKVTIKIKRKK